MQGARLNANTLKEDDKVNWKFIPAQDGRPAYYLYDSEIHKSVNDDREYRFIRLENGLEAVLVHDAKTDKAAASMNVTVGSFNDPVDPFNPICTVKNTHKLFRMIFPVWLTSASI